MAAFFRIGPRTVRDEEARHRRLRADAHEEDRIAVERVGLLAEPGRSLVHDRAVASAREHEHAQQLGVQREARGKRRLDGVLQRGDRRGGSQHDVAARDGRAQGAHAGGALPAQVLV